MGDLIPTLADLICPVIDEVVKIDWAAGVPYDKDSHKIGRYRGSFVIAIYDDWVKVRTTFDHLQAADPNFIERLKKHVADAKADIDEFEYGADGRVPRQ